MLPRRLVLLAVAAVLCLSAGCSAQEFKQQYSSYKEVPGIKKGDDGQRYVMVGEEEAQTKYIVAKDTASKLVYFIHSESNEPQWHDPRGPAPSAEEPETIDIKIPIEPPKPAGGSITLAIVAMLPLLLFAGGTAARVAYLQMHYPELLWPTKERKDRRKAAGGKVRAQKQHGKMNQDGKGGRSANS